MSQIHTLLSLVSPTPTPSEDGPSPSASLPDGKNRRRALALLATGLALPMTALWGVAAGSVPGRLALDNALEVPIMLVIAALAALPIGLFAVRLASPTSRGTEFLLAHSAGFFASAVVLVLLSPIVGLFQHSSAWAGRLVAFGSATAAAAVGFAILFRVLAKLIPEGPVMRAMVAPIVVVLGLECAALAQVASISSPIFAERSALGQGADAIHHDHHGER